MNKEEIESFKNILYKNNVDFIYKDSLGILSSRKYSDNFEYIFKTKYSCDAVPMMEALNKYIKGAKVAFDIGANIGITSVWLANNSEFVYAFEPEPINIARLYETISLNHKKNIKVIESVVSNTTGQAALHTFDSYGHHGLSPFHVSNKMGELVVDSITLDEFCKLNDIKYIDVIKIDVEGFEYEVLQGATKLLQEQKIKMIIFEHSPLLFNKQKRDINQVINLLMSFRYRVFTLEHQEVFVQDVIKIGQADLFACPYEVD